MKYILQIITDFTDKIDLYKDIMNNNEQACFFSLSNSLQLFSYMFQKHVNFVISLKIGVSIMITFCLLCQK